MMDGHPGTGPPQDGFLTPPFLRHSLFTAQLLPQPSTSKQSFAAKAGLQPPLIWALSQQPNHAHL